MKLQIIIFCLFIAALGAGLSGCAHSDKAYDPSRKSAASADAIQVVSIAAKPIQPVAPNPWQVTMKIKNAGSVPLDNVTYKFLLNGKGESLGEGKIARLAAGETVSVTSDVAKVAQGTYHVEGRVFLEKPEMEPEFRDRMNNWASTTVVVAQ
jgi:hypothetical protein